jgi:hypothetical protein
MYGLFDNISRAISLEVTPGVISCQQGRVQGMPVIILLSAHLYIWNLQIVIDETQSRTTTIAPKVIHFNNLGFGFLPTLASFGLLIIKA